MTLNFPKAKLVTLAPGLRPERRFAPLARGLNETDGAGKAMRVFLLDFSKAFDLIDHTILLQKLSNMSVP